MLTAALVVLVVFSLAIAWFGFRSRASGAEMLDAETLFLLAFLSTLDND
ncbi:hypothetical protein [Paraburkholderia sp.]